MTQKVKIIFKKGERAGESVEFSPPGIFIGRDSDNDICFQTDTVSQFHAEITLKDEKWYIQDKKSSNGTKLNGKKISEKTERNSRDMIYTGTEVFMVELLEIDKLPEKSEDDNDTIKLRPPYQKKPAPIIEEKWTEEKEIVPEKRKSKPSNSAKNDRERAERRLMNRLVQETLQQKKKRLSKTFITIAIIVNIIILCWWLSTQGYEFEFIKKLFDK